MDQERQKATWSESFMINVRSGYARDLLSPENQETIDDIHKRRDTERNEYIENTKKTRQEFVEKIDSQSLIALKAIPVQRLMPKPYGAGVQLPSEPTTEQLKDFLFRSHLSRCIDRFDHETENMLFEYYHPEMQKAGIDPDQLISSSSLPTEWMQNENRRREERERQNEKETTFERDNPIRY